MDGMEEEGMHVSVFEYRLTGIAAEAWAAACVEQLAPASAAVPGFGEQDLAEVAGRSVRRRVPMG